MADEKIKGAYLEAKICEEEWPLEKYMELLDYVSANIDDLTIGDIRMFREIEVLSDARARFRAGCVAVDHALYGLDHQTRWLDNQTKYVTSSNYALT